MLMGLLSTTSLVIGGSLVNATTTGSFLFFVGVLVLCMALPSEGVEIVVVFITLLCDSCLGAHPKKMREVLAMLGTGWSVSYFFLP